MQLLFIKHLTGMTHFKVKCNLQKYGHDRFQYLLGNKTLERLRYNET